MKQIIVGPGQKPDTIYHYKRGDHYFKTWTVSWVEPKTATAVFYFIAGQTHYFQRVHGKKIQTF